jgi:hypothetical protein
MKAKNIDRFSIVRYNDELWMLENRGKKPLLVNGDKGKEISNDTELEVVMFPAQLAQNFLINISAYQ